MQSVSETVPVNAPIVELPRRATTARSVAYWLTTALLAAQFLAGGLANVLRVPVALAGLAHLGYPAYFGMLLGVWKILGAVALVVPGYPRLKEWAYAGVFFDVTAAAVSIVASGDPTSAVVAPLFAAVLTVVSWGTRPPSRVLGSLPLARAKHP